jgi:hypothetical protein
MAISFYIRDGTGSGREAGVTKDHALKVSVIELGASEVSAEILTRKKLFRGYLTDTQGSNSLNVDGSSTPVQFSVTADVGATRWITGIRYVLHGESLEINTNDFRRFGMAAIAPGLTNGITIYIEQGGGSTSLFIDPIQSIGDFLPFADDFTNLVNSVDTQKDYLDFEYHFDIPIVLPLASADRIVTEIRDDLTALALFKAIVRGYQELT